MTMEPLLPAFLSRAPVPTGRAALWVHFSSRRSSPTVVGSAGAMRLTPALLTSTPARPSSLKPCWTECSKVVSSVRSPARLSPRQNAEESFSNATHDITRICERQALERRYRRVRDGFAICPLLAGACQRGLGRERATAGIALGTSYAR